MRKLYINEKINTDPSNIPKELERFYCKLYAIMLPELIKQDLPF